MNLLKLLDSAKSKLLENDPYFHDRTGLILDILRTTGAVPFKRSKLNGSIHTNVAAALVIAYEANTSIDVTIRRAQTIHDLGHSTKVIGYLDNMVKQDLLISRTNRADGRLYLGNILTTYLDQPLAA